MLINRQRYAFFKLDEELKQYCIENMYPEYSDLDYNTGDSHILRINCTNNFVFPKPSVYHQARQRPFLPREEFFVIAAIADSEAKAQYITKLYQEQFEALKE